MKIIARNKKALVDYEIKEKLVAGIVLKGFEVKAIKTKGIDINHAYVIFSKKEPYLVNANIPPYQAKNLPPDWQSNQPRKLLLKKREAESLESKRRKEKLHLIPLEVFEKNNLIKVKIALAKIRKKYDKREKIKERESKRRIERKMKKIYRAFAG